jgi:uncharacterized protein
MLQPAAIDGLAFARSAGVCKGRLGMVSMPRLAQSGCSGSVIDFVLAGEINERGKPELRLAVDGSVRLECQRCLAAVDLPLKFTSRLELASSEADVLAAGDDVDRVVASREMSLAELVEDEILLALPMVPRHAQCRMATEAEGGAGPSAFRALAALKKSNR